MANCADSFIGAPDDLQKATAAQKTAQCLKCAIFALDAELNDQVHHQFENTPDIQNIYRSKAKPMAASFLHYSNSLAFALAADETMAKAGLDNPGMVKALFCALKPVIL